MEILLGCVGSQVRTTDEFQVERVLCHCCPLLLPVINLGDRSVGGCKESEVGIVSTVQLKGLEDELKGLEWQATVKTNYANHSCSLR